MVTNHTWPATSSRCPNWSGCERASRITSVNSILTGLVLFCRKWVLETLSPRPRPAHNMCSPGIAPRVEFQLPRHLVFDGGGKGTNLPIGINWKGQTIPLLQKSIRAPNTTCDAAELSQSTLQPTLTSTNSNSPVQFSSNLVDALQSNSEVCTPLH